MAREPRRALRRACWRSPTTCARTSRTASCAPTRPARWPSSGSGSRATAAWPRRWRRAGLAVMIGLGGRGPGAVARQRGPQAHEPGPVGRARAARGEQHGARRGRRAPARGDRARPRAGARGARRGLLRQPGGGRRQPGQRRGGRDAPAPGPVPGGPARLGVAAARARSRLELLEPLAGVVRRPGQRALLRRRHRRRRRARGHRHRLGDRARGRCPERGAAARVPAPAAGVQRLVQPRRPAAGDELGDEVRRPPAARPRGEHGCGAALVPRAPLVDPGRRRFPGRRAHPVGGARQARARLGPGQRLPGARGGARLGRALGAVVARWNRVRDRWPGSPRAHPRRALRAPCCTPWRAMPSRSATWPSSAAGATWLPASARGPCWTRRRPSSSTSRRASGRWAAGASSASSRGTARGSPA